MTVSRLSPRPPCVPFGLFPKRVIGTHGGPPARRLSGTAPDLRCGAIVVLLGCCARGGTDIRRTHCTGRATGRRCWSHEAAAVQVIDDPVHDELFGWGLIGSHAAHLRRASRASRPFDFASWFGGRPCGGRATRIRSSRRSASALGRPWRQRLSELPELATWRNSSPDRVTIDASAENLRALLHRRPLSSHDGASRSCRARSAPRRRHRADYSALATGCVTSRSRVAPRRRSRRSRTSNDSR